MTNSYPQDDMKCFVYRLISIIYPVQRWQTKRRVPNTEIAAHKLSLIRSYFCQLPTQKWCKFSLHKKCIPFQKKKSWSNLIFINWKEKPFFRWQNQRVHKPGYDDNIVFLAMKYISMYAAPWEDTILFKKEKLLHFFNICVIECNCV